MSDSHANLDANVSMTITLEQCYQIHEALAVNADRHREGGRPHMAKADRELMFEIGRIIDAERALQNALRQEQILDALTKEENRNG